APQPGVQITRGVDGVVGQDQERLARLAQLLQKGVGTGDRDALVNEHTVHVGEPRLYGPAVCHVRDLLPYACTRCWVLGCWVLGAGCWVLGAQTKHRQILREWPDSACFS